VLFLLAVLISAKSHQPPAKVEARARASVIIVDAVAGSGRDWNPAGDPSQREVVLKEADGRLLRLRLTEHQ
jgi:hypothetical protein